jgi:hypothetical protein
VIRGWKAGERARLTEPLPLGQVLDLGTLPAGELLTVVDPEYVTSSGGRAVLAIVEREGTAAGSAMVVVRDPRTLAEALPREVPPALGPVVDRIAAYLGGEGEDRDGATNLLGEVLDALGVAREPYPEAGGMGGADGLGA